MNSETQNKRVFPDLSREFYTTKYENVSNPDEQTARRFLSLHQERLNFWQRNLEIGLGATGTLTQLMKFHAAAVENEFAGETKRADYYWRQFLTQLIAVKDRAEIWRPYHEKFNPREENRILLYWDDLARAFFKEVVLPLQLGFYVGYLTEFENGDAAQKRAALHSEYFAKLHSAYTYDETVSIIFPQVKAVCRYLADRSRSFAALDLCEILRGNLSTFIEWQELFLSLKRESIFALANILPDDAENQQLITSIIETEQNNLDNNWNLFRNNLIYFNVRADFSYLQAVKLANAGDIVAALNASEVALAFQPLHFEAHQLSEMLLDQIQEIQTRLVGKEDEQEIVAILTSQVNEALLFQHSQEARNIEAARQNAVALEIWREIGLEKKKGFTEKAALLTNIINSIVAALPENEQQLQATWFEQNLTALDFSDAEHEKIFQYLRKNLFGSNVPETESELSAPVFIAAAPSTKPQEVEWSYWLFGPEDRGVKMRTAISVAAVLIIGFFIVHEFTTSYLRNRSFSQMREAVRLQDYRQAAEAAEDFLSYSSFWGTDERQKRVLGFYDEAIVRLVLEQPDQQLPPEINAIILRHEKSTQNLRLPIKKAETPGINAKANNSRSVRDVPLTGR